MAQIQEQSQPIEPTRHSKRRSARRGVLPGPQREPLPAACERATAKRTPLAASQALSLGRSELRRLGIAGGLLAIIFLWSYWPTLVDLWKTWGREPDYSHGYLVPLVSAFFFWAKRDRFPGVIRGLDWPGLILLGSSAFMRYIGARFLISAVEAWSMVFWIAGVFWLLGGRRFLVWSLPAIAFLLFMIPLPYRIEQALSQPLQQIATGMSSWVLQTLGQPALAEGNRIHLGDLQLEVEQACSGLRIFMGIVALAFAYLILIPRQWWERVLLLAGIIPIALVANSTRIVITGLLNLYVSTDAAKKFNHDAAGFAMIPLAAAMFAGLLWYSSALFREVELVDVRRVVRKERR